MISKATIENTLAWQRDRIARESTLPRDLLPTITPLNGFATVITGIRRCGKSTLVGQMLQNSQGALYLNFDTPVLYGFTMDDFKLLDMIIDDLPVKQLYFDEIQVVCGWEIYVRGKLDEGFEVTVTGSNASMLSRELGTHLTGRHISKSLYPFSFAEFCRFKNVIPGVDSFNNYLELGGFPQFLQTGNEEILQNLVNDIVYRDIMVRFGLKEDLPLKKLLQFLLGNIGNTVSANSLKSVIGVKGAQTVLDYFSYLENSYLFNFVPKFSYSYRAQQLNPKKVYCIDSGLHTAVSPSFSRDVGHKLENVVYLELRRHGYELFYFAEQGHECDFIACRKNVAEMAIQVCYDFNPENYQREVQGLVAACNFFKLDGGLLLTNNQTDELFVEGRAIHVRPAWKYMALGS